MGWLGPKGRIAADAVLANRNGVGRFSCPPASGTALGTCGLTPGSNGPFGPVRTRFQTLFGVVLARWVILQIGAAFAFGCATISTWAAIRIDPEVSEVDFFSEALLNTVAFSFILELDSLPCDLFLSWLERMKKMKGETSDVEQYSYFDESEYLPSSEVLGYTYTPTYY